MTIPPWAPSRPCSHDPFLEPKVLEQKYYAKGIGPVLAVGVSNGSREELVRFERR
jgi:hypothetical protein